MYRDLNGTVFPKRFLAIIYRDEVQHVVSTQVYDKDR